MTEHQLQWTRDTLRWGYAVWIDDRERHERPATQYHATATRRDPETGCPMQPDIVRASEPRAFKRSSTPCAPWAFAQGQVVRAASQQPDGVREWLRYAYGPAPVAWPDMEALVAEVWRQWQQQNQEKLLPASLKLMKALAFLAVQDERIVASGGEAKPQKEIALLAGKAEKTWHNNWSPRWRLLQQIVRGMDRQGLVGVYRMLDSRGRNELTQKYRSSATA